jgi:hypothetical protein
MGVAMMMNEKNEHQRTDIESPHMMMMLFSSLLFCDDDAFFAKKDRGYF